LPLAPSASERRPQIILDHHHICKETNAVGKTATIHVRIEEELKAQAHTVLGLVGVSPSDVITMLYRQIVLRQGVPFDLSIPNATSRRVARKAHVGQED
jgi:DNA-damage-inducible protein J